MCFTIHDLLRVLNMNFCLKVAAVLLYEVSCDDEFESWSTIIILKLWLSASYSHGLLSKGLHKSKTMDPIGKLTSATPNLI